MIYLVLAILVMALPTYLLRAVPVAFIHKKIENKFIKSFLFYVPYAVLAALTFPAVFYFIDNIYIALISTAVAIILSLFNQKLYIVAIVSVFVAFILQFAF